MDTNILDTKNKNNKYDKFFLIIVIIDTLFFPYIRFLNVSMSMIIIPFWFLLNLDRVIIDKEIKLFFIFLFFSSMSLLFSFVNYPQYVNQNVISLFMLIYGFFLYFYLNIKQKKLHIEIDKILIVYLFFVFILSLVYFFNTQLYFVIRSFWSLSGNVVEANSLLINRFTGTLSDPNNLATVVNAIALFLLSNNNISKKMLIIILFITGFITISTLSTTGIGLYIFTFVSFLVIFLKDLFIKKKREKKKVFKFLLFTMLVMVVAIFLLNSFFQSSLFDAFFLRTTTNSVDSRFRIWTNLLKAKNILSYILIGDGGSIVINNKSYSPHSGHLHLIFNYGIIAYLIFMNIFFKFKKSISKLRNHLFLVPLFIGFTVNVGIIDFRFYTILALLISFYKNK